MRTKLIFLLALMFQILAAAAADKSIPVAVFDFVANEGEIRVQSPKLTALITANLASDPRLIVVERTQLSKALSEQALGLSGNVSAEAAAQLGHITGAKVLVSGFLFKHGWGRGRNTHLLAVAYIVGTETSRLYTEKIESASYPTDLPMLADQISDRIVTNILRNITNLVTSLESHDDRVQKIISAPKGNKRPVVFVNVLEHTAAGATNSDIAVNIELGMILQKTGFTVVDEKSDRKADIEITGVTDCACGSKGTDLFSCRATIAVKLQERATGRILAFDRQESSAIDLGQQTAGKLARERAADDLAARLIPLLSE